MNVNDVQVGDIIAFEEWQENEIILEIDETHFRCRNLATSHAGWDYKYKYKKPTVVNLSVQKRKMELWKGMKDS